MASPRINSMMDAVQSRLNELVTAGTLGSGAHTVQVVQQAPEPQTTPAVVLTVANEHPLKGERGQQQEFSATLLVSVYVSDEVPDSSAEATREICHDVVNAIHEIKSFYKHSYLLLNRIVYNPWKQIGAASGVVEYEIKYQERKT